MKQFLTSDNDSNSTRTETNAISRKSQMKSTLLTLVIVLACMAVTGISQAAYIVPAGSLDYNYQWQPSDGLGATGIESATGVQLYTGDSAGDMILASSNGVEGNLTLKLITEDATKKFDSDLNLEYYVVLFSGAADTAYVNSEYSTDGVAWTPIQDFARTSFALDFSGSLPGYGTTTDLSNEIDIRFNIFHSAAAGSIINTQLQRGNDPLIISGSIIPEPASLTLLALLGGLICIRRRAGK